MCYLNAIYITYSGRTGTFPFRKRDGIYQRVKNSASEREMQRERREMIRQQYRE